MKLEITGNYYRSPWFGDDQSETVKTTFTKLKDCLDASGYPGKGKYSFGNPMDDDCTSICKDGDLWAVFYLERGTRFSPAFFLNLDDAIDYFLWKLTQGTVTFSTLEN
jgi:hypothetical protein